MKQLISEVEQMRVAQRHYWAQVNRAKKSNLQTDWADVKSALATAKHYESKVDRLLHGQTNLLENGN